MIKNTHDVNLNIKQSGPLPTDIVYVSADNGVNELKIKIRDGSTEINYSEVASGKIIFAKPDNTTVQGDLVPTGSGFTYMLGTNEIAAEGKLLCSVCLYGSAGERLTVSRFVAQVGENPIKTDVVNSSTQFDALVQAEALLDELQQRIDELPEAAILPTFAGNAGKALKVNPGATGVEWVQIVTTSNDYTTAEKNKLAGISENANNYTHPSSHSADMITDGTTNKAYTATEKTKLAGIAVGAEVNVNADWAATSGDAQILNKPDLYLDNFFINPNFDVAQRTISKAITASEYILDHWKEEYTAGGATMPTVTVSQQAATPGEILGSRFFHRLAVNGAGSSFGSTTLSATTQPIENGTRLYAGLNKKVTISFYARSSIAGKKLGLNIVQNYGTGGSPTAEEELTGTVFTLTSSWVKYSYTFTTNTLAGKTFGTANNDMLKVRFFNAWGTSFNVRIGASSAETFVGSGYIDIAQSCGGRDAMPFSPRDFEDELRKCKRFFRKSYPYAIAPGSICNDGQFTYFARNAYQFYTPNLLLDVPMRTKDATYVFYTPTGGTQGYILQDAADFAFANSNVVRRSENCIEFSGNGAFGTVYSYLFQYTADDEIF